PPTSFATASARSRLMSATATLAPASARSSAVSRPEPYPPPTTSAGSPSRPKIAFIAFPLPAQGHPEATGEHGKLARSARSRCSAERFVLLHRLVPLIDRPEPAFADLHGEDIGAVSEHVGILEVQPGNSVQHRIRGVGHELG